jgi:PAS domain S-box-containing protein
VPGQDSYSLFSSVRSVRELLERKARENGSHAKGELEAGLQEIETLWQELRARSDELASERQRYTEFFEYAPEAYVITDSQGVMREVNRCAAELLAIPARALNGKPLGSLVPEDCRREFRAHLLRAGAESDGEISAWRGALAPQGRRIVIHFRVRAMPAPEAGLTPLCWLLRRSE